MRKGCSVKRLIVCVAVLAFANASTPVFADPDKDESGHGRYEKGGRGYKGGEYKETYWDGNCKVERKWEKNGKYKEERKCEGPRHYGNYPPHPYQEPGVVIQPPGIVIQPPPIIIK
jgi:hypothetical protein